MPTEKEKMLAGEWYDPLDPQLVSERGRARQLLRQLNEAAWDDAETRARVARTLFGSAGPEVWIEPPFYCDYGCNIMIGRNVFFNFNCVVLDPAPVRIGDHTLFGPAVQIYTATHPMTESERRAGLECARAVTIGSGVWVGGGAIILPGVAIGSCSVIGAGSVVTKDVPAGVFAAGNPCRILRPLEPV